jgi:hypothetical protein
VCCAVPVADDDPEQTHVPNEHTADRNSFTAALEIAAETEPI